MVLVPDLSSPESPCAGAAISKGNGVCDVRAEAWGAVPAMHKNTTCNALRNALQRTHLSYTHIHTHTHTQTPTHTYTHTHTVHSVSVLGLSVRTRRGYRRRYNL